MVAVKTCRVDRKVVVGGEKPRLGGSAVIVGTSARLKIPGGGIGPIGADDRVAVIVIDGDDAVPILVEAAQAEGLVVALLEGVFTGRIPELDVRLRVVRTEILFQDDVDHTGHGVRAVDGRRTVRKHFDPLHVRGADAVEIEETILAVGGVPKGSRAQSVDQDQRRLRSESAKRDKRSAAIEAQPVVSPVGKGIHLRHVLKHIGNGKIPPPRNISGGDGQDGGRPVGVGRGNHRARNDDRLHLLGFLVAHRDRRLIGHRIGYRNGGRRGLGQGRNRSRQESGDRQLFSNACQFHFKSRLSFRGL